MKGQNPTFPWFLDLWTPWDPLFIGINIPKCFKTYKKLLEKCVWKYLFCKSWNLKFWESWKVHVSWLNCWNCFSAIWKIENFKKWKIWKLKLQKELTFDVFLKISGISILSNVVKTGTGKWWRPPQQNLQNLGYDFHIYQKTCNEKAHRAPFWCQ